MVAAATRPIISVTTKLKKVTIINTRKKKKKKIR